LEAQVQLLQREKEEKDKVLQKRRTIKKGKFLVSTDRILKSVRKAEEETLAGAASKKSKRKSPPIEISSGEEEEAEGESEEEVSDEESDISDCIMLESD
jgi:hypothetical protein